ncbi:MAG: glycosyltransferase [Cyclobacteriaceae bacterium]
MTGRPRRVLVAALDWGLGHAARCIPLVEALQKKSIDVVLAGSGPSLDLLKVAFPSLYAVELPSYRVSYSKRAPAWWSMLLQIPHWMEVIQHEHREIQLLARQMNITVIVSDNRYGCWSIDCYNVFLGHQFRLATGSSLAPLTPILTFFHQRLVEPFQEFWIPDYPERTLTGELSVTAFRPVRFLGLLSRLRKAPAQLLGKDVDVLAVISGPEPQRTVFEQQLFNVLDSSKLSFRIIRGLVNSPPAADSRLRNHLPSDEMANVITSARLVIARSGYSTIMDLAAMGARALLVPTPGQPEQEYLATRLAALGVAHTATSEELNVTRIEAALGQSDTLGKLFQESDYLEQAVRYIYGKIHS